MKKEEEIVEYAKNNNTCNVNFLLIERHLFYVLRDIIERFNNNKITSEQAVRFKNLAIKEYQSECQDWNFKQIHYDKHIENIKKTEILRVEYRKEQDKTKKLEIANKLIELYSGEKF